MTRDDQSPTARAEYGRSARSRVPRAAHATFVASPDRPDPISQLEEQAQSRVQELVPIRYGRMLASPFAFFRGGALIMASDLATTPTSGLHVQTCGDAHLSNFGLFATPERNMVFDLNDFDETHPGPWEWDIKRLTASLVVAARGRTFSDQERRTVVLATAESYRVAMRQFAAMGNNEVWYARLDVDKALTAIGPALNRSSRQQTKAGVAKARSKDSLRALEKLTRVVDGQRQIISDPPLVVPIEELSNAAERATLTATMQRLIRSYRETLATDRQHLLDQFQLLQVARKVVGVGSVGSQAWILLLIGRDQDDPLFLQAKEAQPSVLERFTQNCQYSNQGQRVVAGQRLMQASSDIFLGWDRVDGSDGVRRDFYVRQLQDWKGSADITGMMPAGMTAYGRVCGWTLARAHARSGDRIAIASYLGKGAAFDEALAAFSEAYADQNERDFAALQRAVSDSRIIARRGI